MPNIRMKRRGLLAAGVALAATALLPLHASAQADAWPQQKPVTVIVPFPAGGSTDMVARAIALQLQTKLGGSFVVDNRPGATGTIGTGFVKRAAPDGYTMPQEEGENLMTLLRKTPGKVSFASSGNGSSDHLSAELFWQQTKTEGVHVPYKGGAPAVNDLLGNQVDFSFQNVNAVLPHIRAGKLRAIAVTGDKRSPVLPDVPTLAEAGVKGAEVYSWQGMAAPRGLPPTTKKKLSDAVIAAMQDPETKKRMLDQGLEIVASTPEDFTAFQLREWTRWKTLIDTRHITAD